MDGFELELKDCTVVADSLAVAVAAAAVVAAVVAAEELRVDELTTFQP